MARHAVSTINYDDPREWDFRETLNFPENQRMFCVHYEFEREAERRRIQIDEMRADPPYGKSYTAADFDKFWEAWYKVFFNEELNSFFAESIRDHFKAYFPRPWLSIPVKARKTFVEQFIGSGHNLDLILAEVRPEAQPSPQNPAPTTMPESSRKKRKRSATEHLFRITWRFSDPQLLRAFKKWLKNNRPRKAYDGRGRTSWGDLLKALAAYRLLKKYTAEQAEEFTRIHTKKPLYWDDASWSRAKASVEKILRKW